MQMTNAARRIERGNAMKNFQSLENYGAGISSLWKFSLAVFLAAASVYAAELPKFTGPLKRLGSVEIDAASKTVVATGAMETASGVLDYLAVGPEGKRYESVLRLDVNALDLQTALLLCGAKAGPPMTARDAGPPKGSPVDIWVEWEANGAKKIARGEELIWNHREDKPVTTEWVFTGSVVEDGRLAAVADQSFVATRWDPYAIVNITSDLGKTYTDVFVNTNAVPATNTPVRIYFQSRH